MYELDEQRAVDRELGYGYTASDFGYPDPFDAAMDALREELAATYRTIAVNRRQYKASCNTINIAFVSSCYTMLRIYNCC